MGRWLAVVMFFEGRDLPPSPLRGGIEGGGSEVCTGIEFVEGAEPPP
jgi:hypothetical protein